MRWCGTSACSAALGFAVPMSRPRYTCMESTDTSSTSPRARATSSASADFPEAVGPTIARCARVTREVSRRRSDDGEADARQTRGPRDADQDTPEPGRRHGPDDDLAAAT